MFFLHPRVAVLVRGKPSPCCSSLRRAAAGRADRPVPAHRVTLFTAARAAGSSGVCNDPAHSPHTLEASSSSSSARSATSAATERSSLSPTELLFEIVSPHVASAPCVSRIATVYGNLPPTLEEALGPGKLPPKEGFCSTHRWLRRHFGTLSYALQQLQATNATSHWGIYVSDDKVYTVKAHSKEEAEAAFFTACTSQQCFPQSETESLLDVFQPVFPRFTPPPPPPLQQRATRSKKKGRVPDGMFSPQMLVPYVPTFFIPMKELLELLPDGYTTDHIERIFAATGALEIVQLEGEQFVRLHGGKRLVDFTCDGAGEAAHQRWREYQPDPFLCEPFRRLLSPSPRWTSLRTLITSTPASLLHALLPWRNYKTLLFFAQMQHVFSFTPEGEGEVCWLGPVTCLSYHDSPTPAVVSELVSVLSGQRVCITDLLGAVAAGRISDFAKTQIIMYYGTLVDFFRAHGDVFRLEDGMIVGLVSHRSTTDKPTRTLEDKLEEALVKRDRRTAQKLRRRIALEKDPDNPYADREVLLDAILRYVPQKRSISLNFLLKSLPPSLSDFLPSRPVTMFQQAPEKVRLFEYRYRHRLHLIRPGVPLPPGVLRQHYTEQELLFLCAAELQQQPRTSVDLYGRLPYGAKEVVRLQFKGLLELLQPYPQYFTVVFKDALRVDTRSALVTLLQMPPGVELSEEEYGSLDPLKPDEQRKLDDEDRAAMQTLPRDIQQTMRLTDVEQTDF
ncbi:hypothetical protein DQ04_05751020 [Trypanosoma grayi]|uniref:hypothetical protein n=1 Tax=Trypanosoma grayi TaxID=71804 RepID=UPI0004F404FD|nr:hypothetical protein DQ04_05751020 [Trypanosoma grayi]KEG09133.1 hypothetical protein DQ04_05751020 [Trypanosoma grayi]